MDISQQIATYFASAADATAPGEAVPDTTKGNTVIPLIDSRNYYGEIRKLLEKLGKGPNAKKQFFYITGWWIHLSPGPGTVKTAFLPPGSKVPVSPIKRLASTMPAFQLEDSTSGPYRVMAELLAQKAAAGVDVRVMGWVNSMLCYPMATKWEDAAKAGRWIVVTQNLHCIDYLRNLTIQGVKPLSNRVCALTLGNLFGSMHIKMVVAYDGNKYWAFTGGIDLVPNRVSGQGHPDSDKIKPWSKEFNKKTNKLEQKPITLWHDMAVSITGPAVKAFYDFFRDLWDEQLKRPVEGVYLSTSNSKGIIRSVEPGTKPIPSDRKLNIPETGKHRVQVARTLPQFHFGNPSSTIPITSKVGTKPLPFAPKGKFEIKVAWKKAIENATKYIYMEDPAFWSHEIMSWIHNRVKKNPNIRVILLASWEGDPNDPETKGERVEAINKHLLAGLNSQEKDRIEFYLIKKTHYYVHSKVTIIDDYWLFVGSANCARRSLYTDGELSVAVLDENINNPLAKQVRVELWGWHLGIPVMEWDKLENLDDALKLWLKPPTVHQRVEKAPLPLPSSKKKFSQAMYDYLTDYDSRSKLW